MSQAIPHPNLIQVKTGPRLGPVSKPRKVYLASQRKYDVDAGSPLWKRALFWGVYMPFVRFFFRDVFKFQPPDRVERGGSYSWLEHQGVFFEEWRAEQEAAKYGFGVVLELPWDESLPAASVQLPQVHPNSTAREMYEKVGRAEVSFPRIDVERLERKLRETDHVPQLLRELKSV
jgi:hypothetical protein